MRELWQIIQIRFHNFHNAFSLVVSSVIAFRIWAAKVRRNADRDVYYTENFAYHTENDVYYAENFVHGMKIVLLRTLFLFRFPGFHWNLCG